MAGRESFILTIRRERDPPIIREEILTMEDAKARLQKMLDGLKTASPRAEGWKAELRRKDERLVLLALE